MAYVRPNKATRELRKAVRDGDVAGVVSALERGADANAKDSHDSPPLLSAVSACHAPVVKALLAHGADPNLPLWGEPGNTILMWAVCYGPSDCALELVHAGARVDVWVFKSAAERGMASVVRAMLDRGADINANSSDGTALMVASYRGNAAMVQLLLDRKAHPNRGTKSGWVPLMSAAAMGHVEVVRLLLAAGAEVTARDKDGDTAMKFAAEVGHSEVVKILQGAGITA